MSFNVGLHESQTPLLVSPYENFIFTVSTQTFAVQSGNGYPGQGGCFYGKEGRCFVSQYRVVYVAKQVQAGENAQKSCSIPFYAIREWKFHVDYFGKKTWHGLVNPIQGGGLVGIGSFQLRFASHGFEEFQRHLQPLLVQSRDLYEKIAAIETPSILMVPAASSENTQHSQAYYSSKEPFTIYKMVE
uniref:Uncharacterized protein AlNc14C195G8541 n=1 Tax=Albugo laibachii Nc14 TaxID=890382 RepID=F0WQ60_9STRA|nr:conserved hypothetical protein [Albugo laibachii Nc14]|eukprot:CCA23466.1 conserved hypothetical protein [Albugo laibachii Nc14]